MAKQLLTEMTNQNSISITDHELILEDNNSKWQQKIDENDSKWQQKIDEIVNAIKDRKHSVVVCHKIISRSETDILYNTPEDQYNLERKSGLRSEEGKALVPMADLLWAAFVRKAKKDYPEQNRDL